MRLGKVLRLIVVVGGFVLVSDLARAQVSHAQINGTVRDASGAVVPDATIVLRNTDTGVEMRAASNEQGVYILLHIPPGTYVLEVSKPGFSTSRIGPFDLVVNQASVFDVQLAVGKVQESVTVEAIGVQVQSATAELGTVQVRQQLIDLPYGRNIQNLMRLTPGVNPVSTAQSSIPSVNGQINRSSMFMLDGAPNQATFFSNLALSPIVETLEEFKVQSHNDSAEVGGILGGVINTVTRSGTNEFHGALWEILQNDALNARNTFQPTVNPIKGHTFGGTLGGPVWLPRLYKGMNRTFFFVGYQAVLTRFPAFNLFRVPTEANLRGDLSDWPRPIYNPFTTRAHPDQPGAFIRDPFPGNQIPGSLLKPGMVYLARTVLPQPEHTGVADRNAVNRTPNRLQNQRINVRIDHHFGQRDIVWGRYSGSYDSNQQPGPIPAILNQVRGRAHNFAVSWVHTFSPSTILQVQSARVFVWTRSVAQYRSLPTDFIQQVGYSANILTPYVDGKTYIPNYSPAGFFSTGESMTLLRPGDSLHHKAGLSKLVGNHTLKFGGEHNWVGWYYENGVSSVSFQPAQTADPLRLGTTGSPLASFLLDVPDAATRRDIRETTPWWAGVIGFYFQDSWKASDRLTINLGLRYDRTFIPTAGTEAANNNKVGDMDFNTGTYILQKAAPPCAAVGKPPCIPTPAGAPAGWLPPNVVVSPRGKIYRDTTKNFQPRLGIAYRLNQRTAIRISSGIFFDNYSGVTQISRNFIGTWPSLGWQSVSNLNYPTPSQPLPAISASNPLPSAVLPEPHPFNQVGYFADPNWRNAYSIQWNAGLQHQLFQSTLITMNYVGSGTHRTTVGGPYGVALYPGPGNWRDRAPFRHMPIPISWDRSWGNANYHALQASLERRWARGLAVTTSYTWSKSIDYGHSEFFAVGGAGGIQNPYNMRPDRGVSSYDLTHNLVISWVYNLPLGQGRSFVTGNRIVDSILGNWQVNGIADLRSGMPINLTVSGDVANTGSFNYMRPNLVGDWRVDQPTPQRWFNPSAFAAPAAYTFGNLGRNRLRSDSVYRYDLSLFRHIKLGEQVRAELRLEAYNAFNTVTYNAPVTEFTSPIFGRVLSAMPARSVHINMRLYF